MESWILVKHADFFLFGGPILTLKTFNLPQKLCDVLLPQPWPEGVCLSPYMLRYVLRYALT